MTRAAPTDDGTETFARALMIARAAVELDATLTGDEKRRHRGKLLVRATQGDLASALAFASWVLGGPAS